MPTSLTTATEVATGLGTLCPDLTTAFRQRPAQLINVDDAVWLRLGDEFRRGEHASALRTAFENGRSLLAAADGLRGRAPLRVEWKGPHRPPGDDVVPADLRIDHVFLVSCKYLSSVLLNAGPPRLFERLLVGDERSSANWFDDAAPRQFRALYAATVAELGLRGYPGVPRDMSREQQWSLKTGLSARTWPEALQPYWADLCREVSSESARRWRLALVSWRDQLRLLWRMLRITTSTYFVLGTDYVSHIRLVVDSAWDWVQSYELRTLDIAPRGPDNQKWLGAQSYVGDWTSPMSRSRGTWRFVGAMVGLLAFLKQRSISTLRTFRSLDTGLSCSSAG